MHGNPLYGTHFSAWWDPDIGHVSSSADYTFTATVDRDIYASFLLPHHDECESAYGGSTIGAEPEYGMTGTVHALPNAGWHFVSWTENGTVVSTDSNYSFSPAADRSLVANFDTTPTVTTASASSIGTTSAASGGNVTADRAPAASPPGGSVGTRPAARLRPIHTPPTARAWALSPATWPASARAPSTTSAPTRPTPSARATATRSHSPPA